MFSLHAFLGTHLQTAESLISSYAGARSVRARSYLSADHSVTWKEESWMPRGAPRSWVCRETSQATTPLDEGKYTKTQGFGGPPMKIHSQCFSFLGGSGPIVSPASPLDGREHIPRLGGLNFRHAATGEPVGQ